MRGVVIDSSATTRLMLLRLGSNYQAKHVSNSEQYICIFYSLRFYDDLNFLSQRFNLDKLEETETETE